jgi:transcriptional regulator with XRE-family HTH domain
MRYNPDVIQRETFMLLDKLDAARQKQGISARGLAKECGLYPAQVLNIINHKVMPRLAIVDKMAKVLGYRLEVDTVKYQNEYTDATDMPKFIAECLNEIRNERGLTLEGLGLLCDMKKTQVANLVTGNNVPQLDNLIRIARALDVKVSIVKEKKDDSRL